MAFLYPSFLYFLFALAIPVIIHLFQFRRYKTVYFSSIRFLRQVEEEKKQVSQIKRWLILLSRLLFLTFLILAFAQPYWEDSEQAQTGGSRATSMYLDNSFSMQTDGELQSLFESARQRGFRLVESLGSTDEYQVLTADFTGSEQFLLSQQEAREALEVSTVSPASRNVAEIIARQTAALKDAEGTDRQAFILSDFQQGMLNAIPQTDSNLEVVLVPLTPQYTRNTYLDSIWWVNPVLNPGQTEQIYVRVVHEGEQSSSVTLRLYVDGEMTSLLSLTVEPGNRVDTSLTLPLGQPGFHSGFVELEDPAITFDNRLYFAYTLEEALPVAEITGEKASGSIRQAYATEPYFDVHRVSARQVDYAAIREDAVWVLNGIVAPSSGLANEVQQFVASGGSLLAFPPINADLAAWNALLRQVNGPALLGTDTASGRVQRVFTDHPLYEGVFKKVPENALWPTFNQRLQLRPADNYAEALWTLPSGQPALTESIWQAGRVYVSALPPDKRSSNVTEHSIFLPTLFRVAFFAHVRQPLSYTLGEDNRIPVPQSALGGENYFTLRAVSGAEQEYVPQLILQAYRPSLQLDEGLTQAGVFELYKADQLLGRIALNYNRNESTPFHADAKALEEWITTNDLNGIRVLETSLDTFNSAIQDVVSLQTWWRLCLILALVFFAIEILLIRFLN